MSDRCRGADVPPARTVKIAPSILSADFSRLGEQVREAAEAGADYIHVDVMDGHFVPNLTIGPVVVEWIRQVTDRPLDVHLMLAEPDRYLEEFARAGADILTVHQEATPHLDRTVQAIHGLGKRAGVSLNPATPVELLADVVAEVDLVLIMTVNPGFGGQRFIERLVPKIARARRLIDEHGSRAELEVDGGIGIGTASAVVRAGADVLVAGSAIYNRDRSVAEALARLRDAIA
ncbi:MAG TPA: ribulose-phosphate 3-epimerase [Dehalococcoidia bacterium]|nr:ribulose-phosphate 3-epimerase [Dehalococcoidia bacterium]